MDIASIEQAIYEASIVPERWPEVLTHLTEASGARGDVLFSLSVPSIPWSSMDSSLRPVRWEHRSFGP